MKASSTVFQACWGLAVSSLTPLIVGTQFLGWTPTAQATTWESPCDSDPGSLECDYYQEWQQIQSNLWSLAFNRTYVQGGSGIALEPTADPTKTTWNVSVWESADLDYSDPDLTEQDVLSQIVATGEFEIADYYNLYSIQNESGDITHEDLTYMSMWNYAVAGTIRGDTWIDIPVVGILSAQEVVINNGPPIHVYHLGIVDVPASVFDAVDAVLMMAESAANSSIAGGGPDFGDAPGGLGWRTPIGGTCCPSTVVPDQNCQDCITFAQGACAGCGWFDPFMNCALAATGVTLGAIGICLALCLGPQAVLPSCWLCIAISAGVGVGILAYCAYKATQERAACIANVNLGLTTCWGANNCIATPPRAAFCK